MSQKHSSQRGRYGRSTGDYQGPERAHGVGSASHLQGKTRRRRRQQFQQQGGRPLLTDRCGSVRYTFCPRLRREVFYDRQSRQCVAKKSPQDGRCGLAPSRPCNERQSRFLYFADVDSADGEVRCLKASQTTPVGRRCLVGPNRFDSIAKCGAAEARRRRLRDAVGPAIIT
ncbi:hypothetical protein HPB50_005678 [Hyalomma asiaticum]|uniref:Uncharacterized protein n=1 Tax=Hyalomma asiaticum TaxID=266040 RepID=A0ACB7S0X6_HYAAI|nr:hypothetical protein HPB50_005678 [Hyalomma asiaticum]